MKKLLVLMIALMAGSVLSAQESDNAVFKKSFLAFHAGPSFPISNFASNNPGNEEAGMAKTGFIIGMNYGYRFNSTFGLEAAAFYNQYAGKKTVMTFDLGDGTESVELSLDKWHLYGLTLGPSLEFSPAKKPECRSACAGRCGQCSSACILLKWRRHDRSRLGYRPCGTGRY